MRTQKVRSGKATPWHSAVAGQLRELKRERRQAERRWRSTRLTVHKQIYDAAKEKVAQLIFQAKTSFFSSLISSVQTSKQMFDTTSYLLGKTKCVSLPSIPDIKALPGLFSDFFKQKIAAIRNSFPQAPQNTGLHSPPPFSGTALTDFSPVSEDLVRKVILQAPPKSCELDPLPTKLLVEHLDVLLPTITQIMNDSIVSGTVPSDFKSAIVKPLLKKNSLDPNELKNYRPISNLPFLSKVLERLILLQLSSHLTTNNLLSPHQSAYRAGHSTETALLRILNDILSALDENKISVLLLLDLSSAFDTIDHDLLLNRLESVFGIRDTALNWFHSYLSDRKQRVVVQGSMSSETTLEFGVPQGSVLGPVLFILYTTPLTHLINSHSIDDHEMFADDTQLNHSVSPANYSTLTDTLQDCFSDVGTWMSENRLKLNGDKTEAIRFSPSSSLSSSLPSDLHLGSTRIQFSDCVRNLGVFFDSNLSLKHHITKTCQAAYIQIKLISSIRHFLTQDATKTLVSALVLSRLDYCNSLLSGCPKSLLKPLQQVQNSAAKLIFKARKSQHCTPLFIELHWLPIEQRIKYKSACLCFQIISETAPAYLTDLFEVYTPSRSLRSATDTRMFRVPKYNKKTCGYRAFSRSAVQTWNSLPYALRHSPSLPAFKSQLKTHLFRQYYT